VKCAHVLLTLINYFIVVTDRTKFSYLQILKQISPGPRGQLVLQDANPRSVSFTICTVRAFEGILHSLSPHLMLTDSIIYRFIDNRIKVYIVLSYSPKSC